MKLYKGLTSNLEKRLHQHRLGQSNSTKFFGKFKLVLSEIFLTRAEARAREKYFKSGSGREWLQKQIE